jgi:U3 small nucleolar ribonucleoprotein protein IMP4
LRDEIAAEDDRTALPHVRAHALARSLPARAHSLAPAARPPACQTHVDDEYAASALREPKVCVTTSRDPSSRLRQFAKEVRLLLPHAARINRGNTTVAELVDAARNADFTDLVLVQETRGEPDALVVSHLPFGPTVWFTLSGAVLRHDIPRVGPMSEEHPHLILQGFRTPLGARVASVLRHLFPVPKPAATRVVTFANDADHISFRHHTFERDGDGAAARVALREVGPRFEMRPYQITLGTLDATAAEVEWVLRPYMNSARKRDAL